MITNKCRIESLETWVNKQDETIKNIRNDLEKESSNKDIETLKEKVAGLESSRKESVAINSKIDKKCNL